MQINEGMSVYQVTYGAGYQRAADRRVFMWCCSFLLWRPATAWREAPSSTPAGAARRELGWWRLPGARREPGEGTTCWRRWRASVRCRVPSGTAFYLRMCNDHTALGTIKLRKKLFCVGVGMYWEVFRSISMHCKRALLWKYMTLWTCRGSAPKLN